MSVSRSRPWLAWIVIGLAVTSWVIWLRAPTFHVTLWNVDEAIHAAAARTILEGGVMYRDAVDQRTPLSYYAVAAVFRITGINNLPALRCVIAGIIVFTALALFALGRRSHSLLRGAASALVFAGLSSYLLSPDDAYAAHTEWFVALFTTLGAVVFWSGNGPASGLGRMAATGALFGAAFLSKQPALLDLAAPLGTLAYLALTRTSSWRAVVRAVTGVLGGFAMIVGGATILLWAAGASADFLFYAWTYNVRYYGPDVSAAARLFSGVPFFLHLAQTYPIVLASALSAVLVVFVRVVQLRPSPVLARAQGAECYLLLWSTSSLAAAISSGRGFDHYFIEFLPAFSWLAAWTTDSLVASLLATAHPSRRFLASLALSALAVNVLITPFAARQVIIPPPDPALPVARFINTHSQPEDKIFVWGYNPDIYLYSDRASASRFLYCTFQTGLIPWTNLDPAKDTHYAVVPGSMDTLMVDLHRNSPLFIVDCGVGPHRHFEKYPLDNFEPLRRLTEESYAEIDPAEFRPRGFRLYMRLDRSRGTNSAATVTRRSTFHPKPEVRTTAANGVHTVTLSAGSNALALERIALVIDEAEVAALRFPPTTRITFSVKVPMDSTQDRHQLFCVAKWTDGSISTSEPQELTNALEGATEKQRLEFALPLATARTLASSVRALFNPNVESAVGEQIFNLHAPSLVRYELPVGVSSVRGHFGILPGAYAPENKAPTDGALFLVRIVNEHGKSRDLFSRLLDPARVVSDRASQSFRVAWDPRETHMTLELEIAPGPNGSASSDWTYWSDVILEAYP